MISSNYSNNLNNSHNISFQGYKTAFSKQFENFLVSDKPSLEMQQGLMDSFQAVLGTRMNNKFKLGSGRFNTVYRIDDYYTFRVDNDRFDLELPEKVVPKYSGLKNYYGQSLGHFGDITIMKNAVGTNKNTLQAGIPHDLAAKYEELKSNGKMPPKALTMVINKIYNHMYLPNFASLPQSSYDNVVASFASLNKQNKSKNLFDAFDSCNANNFLKVGKKIRIVDEFIPSPYKSNISNVLHAFLRDYGGNDSPKTLKMKKEIFKKCITSAVKHDFIQKGDRINDAMQIAHIQETPEKFLNNIAEISQLKGKQKTAKLKEYLETL